MARSEQPAAKPRQGLSALQKGLLYLLVGVLVLSMGARFAIGQGWLASEHGSNSQAAAPGGGDQGLGSTGKGFVEGLPGGAGTPAGSGKQASNPGTVVPGSLEDALPIFTEASFFGLIGFSLGYLSRKVFKLVMIFVALFFIGVQALVHFGIIPQVDWPVALQKINDFILNLKENQTLTQWLTDRVPTAGALLAGYFLGLKRG